MRTLRVLGLAATLSALALGCGSKHRADRDLAVMSRNVYLGADLDPVIGATTQEGFVAATTAAWAMVQKNDFNARALALADEIAARRPALVGLQEAYLWRIQTPGDAATGGTTPATTVVYDHVQLILDALHARGLDYRAAASVTLFDFEAPIATGEDVRATDRGVVLARSDVETASPEGHVFATLLPVTVLGRQLTVPRGWASVVATIDGTPVRFATTHLEAFHAGVRTAQGTELAASLAAEPLPLVVVGDLNSQAGTEGEAPLVASGLRDVWPAVHPGDPGLTCCYAQDRSAADALETRVDYVLTRGAIEARDASVVGTAQVSGRWPSDHAGLVAELRLQ
jgi:endonuclease/exonuclease/phosphatase family metal-dependent hydrolase